MLPESDLWVVSLSNQSAWFARIDWYLNWQMSRGLAHTSRKPTEEVLRLAKDHDLPVSSSSLPAQSPLLVSSKGLVPAGKCLVLPLKGELKEWLAQAKSLAVQMGAQKVHVFLPIGLEAEAAEKIWAKTSGGGENSCTAKFSEEREAAI